MFITPKYFKSPFATPDVLWKECERFASVKRISYGLCPSVERGVRLLRSWHAYPAGQVSDPDLSNAYAIYRDDSMAKPELEARLLAWETDAEIIENMAARSPDLTPGVVRVYSEYFFDVRSRQKASDWLLLEAVQVFPCRTTPVGEADVWRYIAFVAGSFALDILVENYYGQSNTAQDRRMAERARFLTRDHCVDPSDRDRVIASLKEAYRLWPLKGTNAEVATARQLRHHGKCLQLIWSIAKPRAKSTRGRRKASPAGENRSPASAEARLASTYADVLADTAFLGRSPPGVAGSAQATTATTRAEHAGIGVPSEVATASVRNQTPSEVDPVPASGTTASDPQKTCYSLSDDELWGRFVGFYAAA